MILDGAVDPNADPIEADIRQAAFQQAFNDYAPTAPQTRPARWAPTRPRPSMSTAAWWTRSSKSRPRPRIRAI